MLDFTQQLISGVALGCVYGLIALGFVLIYKATEVVNFAQGEIMMLGAFMSVTFIATLGLNYWLSFLLCVIAMAIIGGLLYAGIPFLNALTKTDEKFQKIREDGVKAYSRKYQGF